MQEYRCTANKNKKRQNRHTYRHIDERKLLCHKMENIFCCTYSTVRSGYIIQAIRDGNVDIVTSIPLEKETPAALREKKGRVKRWKTLQTWLGVSGTDLRSAFPFFFIPRIPRAYLIIGESLVFSSVRPLNSLTTSLFSDYTRGQFTRQLDLGKLSKTESRSSKEKKEIKTTTRIHKSTRY